MIKKIQGETGCKLQFIQGKGDGPGDRRCIISGTKQQVEEAKRTIEDLIESVMVILITFRASIASNSCRQRSLSRFVQFFFFFLVGINSNGAAKIIKIAAARTRPIAITAMAATQTTNRPGRRCRLRCQRPSVASSSGAVARPSSSSISSRAPSAKWIVVRSIRRTRKCSKCAARRSRSSMRASSSRKRLAWTSTF